MNQSFENTFRLPYLFKFARCVGGTDFVSLIERMDYEVSSQDPHGFVSIRIHEPPWDYIVNNREAYSFRVKEALVYLASRFGNATRVIDSP